MTRCNVFGNPGCSADFFVVRIRLTNSRGSEVASHVVDDAQLVWR